MWFPIFLIVSLALILALPRVAPWFFGRYGNRVIEPEIKLVFACLLVLMVLATLANGHVAFHANPQPRAAQSAFRSAIRCNARGRFW